MVAEFLSDEFSGTIFIITVTVTFINVHDAEGVACREQRVTKNQLIRRMLVHSVQHRVA